MMYEMKSSAQGVTLSGELTIYTVGDIKGEFSRLFAEQTSMDVDLSGITEIDTAGLQLMLLLKRKPGADLHFIHHSSPVLRLVDLANLAGTLGDPVLISADSGKE